MPHHTLRRALASLLVLFLVSATWAKPVQWKKITGPNFTVITPVDDKEALTWAGDFAQFVAGLHSYIPVDDRRLARLTMVLFGRKPNFDDYRPLAANGKPKEVGGYFWRCDSWAVASLPAGYVDEETRRTLFHESTHWYVSAFEEQNPVWLEEGLAEVFSTFEIEKDSVLWGRAISEHVMALNQFRPMDLEKLLALTQADLFTGGYESDLHTGLSYAQSWAFVHLLIFGKTDVPSTALNDYIRLWRSMNPDGAFQAAFHHSYAEIDAKLRDYMHRGRYTMSRRKLMPVPPLTVEPATTADVEVALAKVTLSGNRFDEALKHAQAAIAAAPELADGYEILGRIYEIQDDTKSAVVAYRSAAERKSKDFRTYFMLASARHREIMEDDPSGQSFTPDETRALANNYERAINLNPRYEPAYASLAAIVAELPPGNDQDAAFVGQGARLFPKNGMIRIGQAVLDRKADRNEEARKRLDEVLAMNDAPTNVREYAHRLDEAWSEQDVFDRLTTLMNAKKFDEASALITQQLADGGAFDRRARLREMQKNISIQQQSDAIRSAMEDGRWADARKALNAVIDSDAPQFLKNQAHRQLSELDKHGLGLPRSQKKPTPDADPAPSAPAPEPASP